MNKHKSEGKCKCARCDAIASGLTPQEADAKQRAWAADCLEKFGFFVHYVGGGDEESPTGFNAHTHGLQAYDNHLDFQIVVTLPPEVGHPILSNLAKRVIEGERFVAGQVLDKVVRGMNVKLVEAQEDSRTVLRIILPDQHGHVEPDEISEPYSVQYQDIAAVPKRKWVAQKHGQ